MYFWTLSSHVSNTYPMGWTRPVCESAGARRWLIAEAEERKAIRESEWHLWRERVRFCRNLVLCALCYWHSGPDIPGGSLTCEARKFILNSHIGDIIIELDTNDDKATWHKLVLKSTTQSGKPVKLIMHLATYSGSRLRLAQMLSGLSRYLGLSSANGGGAKLRIFSISKMP